MRVVWFAHRERLQGDTAAQWAILQRSGVNQSTWFDGHAESPVLDTSRLLAILADADWLVDGLLGTGLSRPVEGLLRSVIETANRSGKPIFALDLPSGLDADTGQPQGMAICAYATATFAAPKLAFAAADAWEYTGEVAVIDIGLPRCLLNPYIVR